MIVWLSLVTLLPLISSVGSQGEDFCLSWVNNNYKIDFGYQAYPYDHEFYNFWYLVIGKKYWYIKYDMDKDTIYFSSTKSREFSLPSEQYRMAMICQNCLKNETINTGFLKKSGNKVDWMQIELNKETGQLTTDNKVIQTNDIGFGPDFNPSIGFDAFPNGFIFLQVKPDLKGKKKYRLSYRGFAYNQTLAKFNDETDIWRKVMKEYMDYLKIKYGPDDTILDNILEDHNYLAVLNPAPSILYNPFMIILFEAEHSLYYCFATEKLINLGCNTNRHPVRKLIDCSNEA